ncbi:phage tail protein [Rubrimonas cliftonensis]|uniref:Microcystin-dependent protein n=1 Tax=Rubrimonas cliftonensis TaxID=89524 RepID=A0A1H4G591_9RHOB|nr:tail fiber protein [Rubrimonas cliftonensis]SEB04765.1 Microcystin-dependent protein [Rubrimonas cliftonensis]
MTDAFIGEIRPFAFGHAPRDFTPCDGRLLQVSDASQLFAVIGARFGGDGRTTFALPDLRGRAPLGEGRGPGLTARTLGESGGTAAVALTAAQSPRHAHALLATPLPANAGPAADALPARAGARAYAEAVPTVAMADTAIEEAGGGAAHENRQPFLVVAFHIAVQGVFPS